MYQKSLISSYQQSLICCISKRSSATLAIVGISSFNLLFSHCSAGVGRTGAFIVIDSMLERIKHEKTVDIYGHVTCLRAQRNYMVQTEDQYIFIHDSLLEAVQSGNTEVPARNLFAHIQKLTQPDQGETVTGMECEFKVNCTFFPHKFIF
jgi:netrin-G3 ligand